MPGRNRIKAFSVPNKSSEHVIVMTVPEAIIVSLYIMMASMVK